MPEIDIDATRQDVPALIAEVERLRGGEAAVRADERRRVLEEICALAGDTQALRQLTENAGADPAGSTGLARARSLLRELAAVGGPLDACHNVLTSNPLHHPKIGDPNVRHPVDR